MHAWAARTQRGFRRHDTSPHDRPPAMNAARTASQAKWLGRDGLGLLHFNSVRQWRNERLDEQVRVFQIPMPRPTDA